MQNNNGRPLRRRTLLAASAGILAMPWVARAQANPLKIGIQSIFSGPIALLGTSSRGGIQPEIDRINATGGLLGRQIQPIYRDSKGQPQEAARVARELVNTDGCEILLDAEASSGAFAVQEVVRDLGVLCVHSNSETSSLTADPKLRVATAFRSTRQGVHDAIVGGAHSARVATAKKLTRWATCSPDYAFGRDTTAQFIEYLKHFMPDIEVISQGWPKLGQPDFTEVITKILQAKPQALYSALYAGDLSAFVNQGNIYALFGAMQAFIPAMGDLPVLTAAGRHPVRQPLPAQLPRHAGQPRMGRRLPEGEQQRLPDQLVVGGRHRDAFHRGGGEEGRQHRRQEGGGGAGRADDRRAVQHHRQGHHAGRGPHHDQLRDRLGHHGAERAVRGRPGARRLGPDHRARDRVEEEERLHLISRDPGRRHGKP
jgi:hypothetical protein